MDLDGNSGSELSEVLDDQELRRMQVELENNDEAEKNTNQETKKTRQSKHTAQVSGLTDRKKKAQEIEEPQLQTLRKLYFGPSIPDQSTSNNPNPRPSTTGSKKRKHDDEDGKNDDRKYHEERPSGKGKQRAEGSFSTKYNLRDRSRQVPGEVWCPDFKYWVNPCWEFGPELTTQDVIRRLGRRL
ncbi:uncharacterized protein TRUGW13939_10616 [Talaromyces rugulosus]|uniref:Uncharacterized protein n=1 Tax=Talaromyces rugulosus TaxID=121627 RepID=A0A7H8RAX1_TALRU|nr:uncharacterized protein TRUGW13939_10616 [Talaromyces rugulosus]QKX63446.1 hypothetical protein TRUGW13939_10616 [Talaromyces rugulosus]